MFEIQKLVCLKNVHKFTFDYVTQQVAQLWQRDRAKHALFSINVQLYSQNHKIAFSSHPIGVSKAI